MPKAEIIAIGTELLLGEIVDTNTPYIAKTLRDFGIDVFHTCTIGDNPQRIATAIQEAHQRADIIISTGGLGPTVDDPTRQAVAIAFETELFFNEQSWQQIIKRFKKYGKTPSENNKQQALFPVGAIPLENPVGTAPIFFMQTDDKIYIALPGVPFEMKYLLKERVIPLLEEKFTLDSLLVSRIIHTSGIGESTIDMMIADLEKSANPTVGLAAKIGQVDIRIAAKAKNKIEANRMLDVFEKQIQERLGDAIYGVDKEALENVALAHISKKGYRLGVVEAGLNAQLINFLSKPKSPFHYGITFADMVSDEKLQELCKKVLIEENVDLVLGVTLDTTSLDKMTIIIESNKKSTIKQIAFTRPIDQARPWVINICLHTLRKVE